VGDEERPEVEIGEKVHAGNKGNQEAKTDDALTLEQAMRNLVS
jgi:hypothetical protein